MAHKSPPSKIDSSLHAELLFTQEQLESLRGVLKVVDQTITAEKRTIEAANTQTIQHLRKLLGMLQSDTGIPLLLVKCVERSVGLCEELTRIIRRGNQGADQALEKGAPILRSLDESVARGIDLVRVLVPSTDLPASEGTSREAPTRSQHGITTHHSAGG